MKIKKKRVKVESKNFFERMYSDSWNYLKSSRKFVFIAIGIFVFFIIVGMFFQPTLIKDKLTDFFKELVKETEGLGQMGLTWYIFKNNIQSAFIGLFGGIFFGVIPAFNAVANGYVLGFVSSAVIQEKGVQYLSSLLPHGIFELPALFISLGLGLRLGAFIFKKDKKKNFSNELLNSLKVFLFIILPLLVIAAIIEGALIVFLG